MPYSTSLVKNTHSVPSGHVIIMLSQIMPIMTQTVIFSTKLFAKVFIPPNPRINHLR